MRTDALSNGYSARSLFGRHYLEHLREFIGQNLELAGFTPIQDAVTGGILQRLGFPWRSRLSHATYADATVARVGAARSRRRGVALAQARAELHRRTAGRFEHRDARRAVSRARRRACCRRCCATRCCWSTRARLRPSPARSAGANLAALLRDPELIDLVNGAPLSTTWKRQLDRKVAAITGTKTIREHLDSLQTFNAPQVAALGAFRDSLEHLQGLDSEALQFLMQGTIDLASYRLDAWITSFATKRLASMRASQPQGVYVGGYGWVENLRPEATARTEVTPPPGEAAPLFAHVNDTGFIHAPSMTHAATAALLRNAQLGSDGVAEANGPFAIDLSSRRVREASWLLDGVRQGQPLAALLGYRFERRLHDLRKDEFIAPLRELAPLTARKLENTDLPVESIAANNVVDGLVLNQKWQDEKQTVTRSSCGAPVRLQTI